MISIKKVMAGATVSAGFAIALALGVPSSSTAYAAAAPQAKAKVAQAPAEAPAPPAPQPVTVTIEPGDMLVKVAEEHQTTYVRIFDANPQIADPNIIHPGDVVRIPVADEALTPRPLPADAPVVAAPAAAAAAAPQPAPATAGGGVSGNTWDRLAQCEASGKWDINTGNGYYGGLQFAPGTWISNGGGQYAALPHQATKEQQIAIAERVVAGQGFNPWPGCKAKLGL